MDLIELLNDRHPGRRHPVDSPTQPPPGSGYAPPPGASAPDRVGAARPVWWVRHAPWVDAVCVGEARLSWGCAVSPGVPRVSGDPAPNPRAR